MWGVQYDENLHKNACFNKIATYYDDLLVKASANNWLICVPRAGVIDSSEFTSDKILDHILIPNRGSTCIFTTLSNKQVVVRDKQLVVIDVPSSSVSILFEETFYIKGLKYTVFCIDRPLSANCRVSDSHKLYALETLHDCIDFLWSENLSHVLANVQKLCANFDEQNRGFALENLQTQKDFIGSLYSQCLQLVLKNQTVSDCDNLKLAVETYMQSCLDKTLLKGRNTLTCFSDSSLNKILCNSSDLQMKDFNIPVKFCAIITNAKIELSKINMYSTVLDKVNCLKLTFNQFCNDADARLTSDDMLLILVFLIVKLNVNNWTSNLVYLTHFRFSLMHPSDEHSYLTTSLEAALEFIRSDEFDKIKSNRRHRALSPAFRAIASDDLEQLRELLRHRRKSNQSNNTLCHPLCACDACTDRVDSSHNCLMSNEKGQTLLMFAVSLHRSEMVEYLLSTGVDFDAADYSGKTALHYACLKGYQDVLLILINYKVTINAKDHSGNTALHLACNNGHETCVKALFYTSTKLDTNCVNKHGDTALHMAVKWNHPGIVRVLLENNTSPNISNKKGQLPIDLAQNYYTERLLRQFRDQGEPFNSVTGESGVKSKNAEQHKKIDLLLKAIESDDFPLTCFYLGFPTIKTEYSFDSKCHPLCRCDVCGDWYGGPKTPTERINVNACNIDGFTPLHFAAKHGRLELLRVLLDSRALPNLKTYKTLQTPLHLACINRRVDIVRELVSCGNCELDSRDYAGNTPLHYACAKKDPKIVEILLNNGANDDHVGSGSGHSAFIKEVREKYFPTSKKEDFL